MLRQTNPAIVEHQRVIDNIKALLGIWPAVEQKEREGFLDLNTEGRMHDCNTYACVGGWYSLLVRPCVWGEEFWIKNSNQEEWCSIFGYEGEGTLAERKVRVEAMLAQREAELADLWRIDRVET